MMKNVLIFGGGQLQISIIKLAKSKGYKTIVIDPDQNAIAKDIADDFIVVDGDDFERTSEIVEKYSVHGIVTAATDKPLIMMSKIAEKHSFTFPKYSSIKKSTNKYLMKEVFLKSKIPCAYGALIQDKEQIREILEKRIELPVIIKPLDSSGSRGVIYCSSISAAYEAYDEAKKYTSSGEVIIEEYIEGNEISVESITYNGKTNTIQITDKVTTKLPYNVEISHIEPSIINEKTRSEIEDLTVKIINKIGLDNCVTHAEFKITKNGPKIIEIGPRLGGDYITSHLVPLSTGINIEGLALDIALNNALNMPQPRNEAAGIKYLELPEGRLVSNKFKSNTDESIIDIKIYIKEGDEIKKVTNSLNRHGHIIVKGDNRDTVLEKLNKIENEILLNMDIKKMEIRC